MKKILFGALVTIFTTASSFAGNNTPLNQKVLKAFSTEFSSAVNVTWSEMKDYGLYHATFTSNQQQLDAFFTEEGELVTTARTIDKQQLPLAVTQKMASQYEGMVMDKEVLEFNMSGYTSYYITMRGPKATLTVKAEQDGTLSVYKKAKNEI